MLPRTFSSYSTIFMSKEVCIRNSVLRSFQSFRDKLSNTKCTKHSTLLKITEQDGQIRRLRVCFEINHTGKIFSNFQNASGNVCPKDPHLLRAVIAHCVIVYCTALRNFQHFNYQVVSTLWPPIHICHFRKLKQLLFQEN